MGDFLEKISPSDLFKDFEWASAQFRKGNQGLIQNWLKDTVGLYDSHVSGSGNHNVHQIV